MWVLAYIAQGLYKYRTPEENFCPRIYSENSRTIVIIAYFTQKSNIKFSKPQLIDGLKTEQPAEALNYKFLLLHHSLLSRAF